MTDADDTSLTQRVLQEKQVNRALGVFLLFFGCVVLVAILFTPTLIGKLTDLVAGAVIGLIGAVMIYRSRGRGT